MINIDDKTRRLSQATIVVGYKQENKAESIEFKIPEYLKEYGKKICFKTKDGKVFSKLFDNTTSNIFTFTRTETQYGELNATIEFFKTENEDMIIYKTSMLQIIFNESIICEDEVQPDEPKIPILESLIEKVTDLNETITENEETRNNNENTRISNENSRIVNETQRDIYYTGIQNKVNNGKFNGATFTPSVDKDGNISWTNNKGLENPTSQNIRGPQGIQGAQGEPFKIKKTYSSIEAMQNDFDNMEVGDYAMIVTSIELEDNAKLYSRTETEWVFITDFSGATGIQGEQGIQGIQGIQGERGIGISKLEVIDGSLWVTLTDSTTQNAGLIITDEVKQWLVTEITNNAESTFNQYYDTKVSEFNENVQAKLDEYNANAEALANKVVELETENTSLKNQIPSGEATGNPIHLSDSSDLECEIVPIGNTEQATREGYNLWNLGNKDNTSGDINFELGSGNYTISFIKKRIANSTIRNTWIYRYGYIKFYDTNNTLLSTISDKTAIELTANQTSERQNISFNAPENTAKMVINFSNNNGDNNKNTEVIDIQLIKGTEEKPYEQYGAMPSPDYPSPVETVGQNGSVEISVDNGLETTDANYQSYTKVLPIQEEMLEGDYIEDVEHHGWGKYEITGNEVWRKSSNSKNISYFLVANSMLVNIDTKTLSPSVSDSQTKVAIVLSNYFKAISPNQLFVVGENGICLNLYNNEIQMRLGFGLDSDINTIDKLKAWLKSLYDAGTPVIVYYKLATPKSLELTEDQKSVLNSFYTYKGITNISVDGIGTLKVNYKKDLETMFNNIIKQMSNNTSDTTET